MPPPSGPNRKATPSLIIRKQDVVGANDAEEDLRWLKGCFVDTGQLTVLRDMTMPQRIILGRTGVGKSALLTMLREKVDRVAVIEPAKLSLSYVSNAPVLQVLRQAGVNLEFFYKLLWRHCFCVELLRMRFPIEGPIAAWFGKLKARLTNKKHLRALNYLEECGDGFFEESDVRVRTLVQNFSQQVGAEVGASFGLATAKVSTGGALTTEERTEIALKAQKVLPDRHRQELADVVDLVDSVLDDDQKPYYLLVDQIDENWVEDDAKYPLIMALLETVKDFKRVTNAKAIVAMRVDLLRKVFDTCRGSGFQEEKYESLCLRVSWSRRELELLANKRVSFTFRNRYAANRELTVQDVFQGESRYFKPVTFLLDRTLQRPRDMIAFLNACIAASDGHSRISKHLAEAAEKEYSESRLRSLRDEWSETFRALDGLCRILLDKRPENFKVADLDEVEVGGRCADHQLTQSEPWPDGLLSAAAGTAGVRQFVRKGLAVLCHVSAVSLKLRPEDPFCSGPEQRVDQILASMDTETAVRIHPMLARALHVKIAD